MKSMLYFILFMSWNVSQYGYKKKISLQNKGCWSLHSVLYRYSPLSDPPKNVKALF